MPDHRASADALLARIKERDRPRLRIYIGAAPGVGKTYEMLQEAHALRARGLDVVVGFVETYDRRDTQAQLKDLEVVPRRQVKYRGTTMEEMDVDGVLGRKPAVAVVDELAHTNVPGSRNVKRYEDVLELLAAGIHVMTAVNSTWRPSTTPSPGRPVCVSAKRCPTRFSIARTKSSTSTSRWKNCGTGFERERSTVPRRSSRR